MEPAKTSTGPFVIGLRHGGGTWQRDPAALARWAAGQRFGFVDFDKARAAAGLAMGLPVGTVDLFGREDYDDAIAPDSPARRSALRAAEAHVERCAAAGATLFFAVTLPANSHATRRQNFDALVESFAALVPVLERTDTRVALEGWPGPGAVCCTPETFRAFFDAVGSDRYGVNYDPSHLVRMGIDPARFAREFAARVFHIHAKDAMVSSDDLYEYGHELPPTFKPMRRWAGNAWRYTLPGRGEVAWPEVLKILCEAGYRGRVSVEMEDEDFCSTEAGEQHGLLLARDFLERYRPARCSRERYRGAPRPHVG